MILVIYSRKSGAKWVLSAQKIAGVLFMKEYDEDDDMFGRNLFNEDK